MRVQDLMDQRAAAHEAEVARREAALREIARKQAEIVQDLNRLGFVEADGWSYTPDADQPSVKLAHHALPSAATITKPGPRLVIADTDTPLYPDTLWRVLEVMERSGQPSAVSRQQQKRSATRGQQSAKSVAESRVDR